MQVHQFVAALSFGDAIGNEARYLQSILRKVGFHSEIFAEATDSRLAGLARPLADYEAISSPDNVVILHFSIGSEASSLLPRLPDRLVLRYHNVTPARWFLPYAPKVARQCLEGRRELRTLARRASLALGASEYNRKELEALGFEPTGVLPLLFDRDRLEAEPNEVVLAMYDDDRTNFLFVGRVMPSKRLEDVMKVFSYYQRFIDRKSRLLFVGQSGDFERYTQDLLGLAERLGLRRVEFVGHVSDAELVAYYSVADVFLCMSEHEGFCAPLLEAFQMDVPVIAYAAGAIPETLGGAGILVHEKRFGEIAELAHVLIEDEGLRHRVLAGQRLVLDRVLARDDSEMVLCFVERVARADTGATSAAQPPSLRSRAGRLPPRVP